MSRLTVDEALSVLPYALLENTALATIAAQEFVRLAQLADSVRIYSNIDNMNDEVLDALAEDFCITWWPKDKALSWKRSAFKACIEVLRHAGTVYSLEKALETTIAQTDIIETDEGIIIPDIAPEFYEPVHYAIGRASTPIIEI